MRLPHFQKPSHLSTESEFSFDVVWRMAFSDLSAVQDHLKGAMIGVCQTQTVKVNVVLIPSLNRENSHSSLQLGAKNHPKRGAWTL